ncbi:MAG: nucleotidyl transferase AbiEii/AbiGii toxin family protein [Polaromonas sp.]|nr:nucleotidyl transferase AbiEii/AbiGii toxin family protein [Polaromonas sp.]
MRNARKPLTANQLREWASLAQIRFLGALMNSGAWKSHELAFHGGTSLHLSWASPRFSEDLDFLIDTAQAERLPKIMKTVGRRLQEEFLVDDPGFTVEIRNKTKDDSRLGNFQIVISHRDVIGNAMVKAEFWMVNSEYLKKYPTVFRTPTVPGHVVAQVSSPIPAAELTSAYADKLTAFATRPFLKWRDLYDLWWLGTQARAVPVPSDDQVIDQFLHNLSGYKTPDGMSAREALARFHAHDKADLAAQAEVDLKRWLPASHWQLLSSMDGVRSIVEYVDDALRAIEQALARREAVVQEVPRSPDPGPTKTKRPKP